MEISNYVIFCPLPTFIITKAFLCNIHRFFSAVKIQNFIRIILIFLLGYTLEPRVVAVLTSYHNLYFGAIIRRIGIPLHTPALLYKSGV